MFNLFLRYPICIQTALGIFTGLLFPLLTITFMLYQESMEFKLDNIISLHHIHYDLLIIWSAPLVLGLAGSYVGRIHWILRERMQDLSDQSIHLDTVLNTAASAIISINQFGIIMSFNKAAELIFGYSGQEIIGQNVKILMPPSIASKHDYYLQQYAKTQKGSVIGNRREVKCIRQNGEEFPALLRVNLMFVNKAPCFTGVIDDISETRILEAQLAQAQKLEAIGQLASGVAHEINTPIQYIGDNLSALKDNLTEIINFKQNLQALLSPELRQTVNELTTKHDLDFILEDSPKAIAQAQDGVNRVSQIVRAMKSFAYPESKQTKQSANLHECITNALTISRNSYKYISKIETVFSDEIHNIECFPNELSQVFLNLIVNAAHAIEEKKPDSGLIKISTKIINSMIEILIEDNGIGIKPEIQEKVFNIFFTTKEVGRGTGQGLSLAHNIVVEKHKGRIFFESTPGIGTTFHIQLPLAT